jgi:hypothetical protein
VVTLNGVFANLAVLDEIVGTGDLVSLISAMVGPHHGGGLRPRHP